MSATEKRRWSDTWQGDCEKAVFGATALLRMSGRKVVASAVLEVLRSAPHSLWETEYADGTAFMRCLTAARHLVPPNERDLFDTIITYFRSEFVPMPRRRREMLEASLSGVLIGFSMGG